MQHCPTCNALLKGAPVCRRCKTDLTRVLQTENDADTHYQMALQARADGHLEKMLHHARRCFSLRRTIAHGRLLACAAFINGGYRLALNIWACLNNRISKTARSS